MLTLFWCPIAILVSYCGCSDDALNEDDSNKKSTVNDKQEGDGEDIIGRTENIQMIATPDTAQSRGSDNGLPSGWRIAYTQDGRVYFQNDITKETQWSHPSATQHMY
eukprot:CAMPEP_0201586458 /NCGR_PEP_ID=MMETSP0190_2-20130828/133161_1 /ASSEMBLY_ACC=CAM_ASM_000263 /TAXON_ID=37353 /ORGANISM="Rosalina sp." /LENGTH=106 /DNA_ID=CAMNT_0048034539 /DNA_START=141 /DNA_END=458 /DNA_ORIENTATION=-